MSVVTVHFNTRPPTREDVARYLELEHTLEPEGTRVLDSYALVDPHTVTFSYARDEQVERDYLLRMLQEHGGSLVDPRTAQHLDDDLPVYAHKHWVDQPWYRRARYGLFKVIRRAPLAGLLFFLYFVFEFFFLIIWKICAFFFKAIAYILQ